MRQRERRRPTLWVYACMYILVSWSPGQRMNFSSLVFHALTTLASHAVRSLFLHRVRHSRIDKGDLPECFFFISASSITFCRVGCTVPYDFRKHTIVSGTYTCWVVFVTVFSFRVVLPFLAPIGYFPTFLFTWGTSTHTHTHTHTFFIGDQNVTGNW